MRFLLTLQRTLKSAEATKQEAIKKLDLKISQLEGIIAKKDIEIDLLKKESQSSVAEVRQRFNADRAKLIELHAAELRKQNDAVKQQTADLLQCKAQLDQMKCELEEKVTEVLELQNHVKELHAEKESQGRAVSSVNVPLLTGALASSD
ncbi:unnamed protein product [Soboliphyme baturini]|uniref:Myosin_tail_1 domain-containing protein n=1 Tax=Soboliphyme baturini TaxID=241478 RepID=A0A183J4J9_9BILA|nr:unnamed protein product [Soboliphyme baturini]